MSRDNRSPDHELVSDAELRSVKTGSVMIKAVKWALIGAMVVGLIAAVMPVLLGGSVLGAGAGAIGIKGMLATAGLSWLFPSAAAATAKGALGFAASAAMSWGTTGAMVGAVGAGLIGLFSGLSNMGQVGQNYIEDKRANAMRAENRQWRSQSFAMSRQGQDDGYGGPPGGYAPRGRGADPSVGR